MKKALKKLQLNRETLKNLVGGRVFEAAGTHYESICKDLCKDDEPANGFARA